MVATTQQRLQRRKRLRAAAIGALGLIVFLPEDLSVLGGVVGALMPVTAVSAQEAN